MSASRRGLVLVSAVVAFAMGGGLLSAESSCQRLQNRHYATASGHPRDNEQYQFASERAWLPCLVERAIANPPSRDGSDKEQRDLIAQESAALWGFWIAAIALLQLLATIIGLVFIKRTLDATWKAVEEASEGTKAALVAAEASARQANISEEIAQRQLRAYLSVSEVVVDSMTPKFVQGWVRIVNLGSTPAKISEIKSRVWVGERNIVDPVGKGPEAQARVFFKRRLGRDQLESIRFRIGEDDDRAKINQVDTDLYVYGRIDYVDIFGVNQWLTFAYTPPGYTVSEGLELVPCAGGNDGT